MQTNFSVTLHFKYFIDCHIYLPFFWFDLIVIHSLLEGFARINLDLMYPTGCVAFKTYSYYSL